MHFSSLFRSLVSFVADLLWPPACILCKKYCRESVCKECRTRSLLYERGSAFCGAQNQTESCAPACRNIYAAGVYVEKYKDAVREYKFHGQLWIGIGFAEIMYQMLTHVGAFDFPGEVIVSYVPVSDRRFAERGFDQSEFIARIIAEKAGVECKMLLKRIVQGERQSRFNRKQRLETSKNRFDYVGDDIKKGKPIDKRGWVILIDDILTTGATLQECASLLQRNGFENIVGAVIATGRNDI